MKLRAQVSQPGLRSRLEAVQGPLRDARERVAQAERAKTDVLLEIAELERSRTSLLNAIDAPVRPLRNRWPLVLILVSVAVPWLACAGSLKHVLMLLLTTVTLMIPVAAITGLLVGAGWMVVKAVITAGRAVRSR